MTKIIATTVFPDSVPKVVVGRWESSLIGAESFAIKAIWLPRQDPKMGPPGGPWEYFSEQLEQTIQEILGNEYCVSPISEEGIRPEHLVPNHNTLASAVRHYALENSGVILTDDQLEQFVSAHEKFGLEFAASYINAPEIIIQRSPPDLQSAAGLLAKSKEWAAPFAGVTVSLKAVTAGDVTNPTIFLLYVAGGIVLITSALALGRAVETLAEAFTKKMTRRIAPP